MKVKERINFMVIIVKYKVMTLKDIALTVVLILI